MAPPSPVVARWDLGRRLREKRELLGLTGAAAGRLVGLSPTFLSDVENGKKNLPEDKLETMITSFEFDNDEAAELRTLRIEAGQRGWWSQFGGLFAPEVLRMYGYEHGAKVVLSYDGSLVSGLLQTRDYARAVIEAGSPNVRLAEADRRVEARMIRQRRLTGEDPLRLAVVMSEAVLHQQIGGPEVLLGQLRHLVAMMERLPDALDVLLVPFSARGHAAMGGSFDLLTFPSPTLPSLAWQQTLAAGEIVEDPTMVREYSIAHASAVGVALSRSDSLGLIKQRVKDLS
jgi:transcriptional regulator with XRE-family HTH domain